jgi:hypothetical protein
VAGEGEGPGRFARGMPGAGFEPATFGLQNRCTTTVLTRHNPEEPDGNGHPILEIPLSGYSGRRAAATPMSRRLSPRLPAGFARSQSRRRPLTLPCQDQDASPPLLRSPDGVIGRQQSSRRFLLPLPGTGDSRARKQGSESTWSTFRQQHRGRILQRTGMCILWCPRTTLAGRIRFSATT